MLLQGNVLVLLFFLLFTLVFPNPSEPRTQNENNKLQTGQLRSSECNSTDFSCNEDFPSEEHTVITEDGYILSIFRIPKGKKCQEQNMFPPVLLMHGLLLDSHSWLDTYPETGLPSLLSDACYDLWLGNVRGNAYGRKHVRLNPNTDSEFWRFYSEEMGRYDLPAVIDYILTYTGADKLNYVSHSQGGRMFFILCSELPLYCNKVGISISLAPAVRLKYLRSVPLKLLIQLYKFLEPFLSKPYELEVLQKGSLIQELGSFFCRNYVLANTICRGVLSIIDSYNPGSIATYTLQKLYKNFPAGTSARNLANYGQNYISQEFRKHDYGVTKNLEVYGTLQPPRYDLNKTTAPVVIIYGENDYLVDKRDTVWLIDQLPNVQEGILVEDPGWNHLDCVYSTYIDKYAFPKINEYLKLFSVP